MNRTSDMAFFHCPICRQKPYVKISNLNYGIAYCKGTLLKKHPLIRVETGYCNPSKLIKTLSNGWNDSHWKTLNDLPIMMHVEEMSNNFS